MSRPIRLATFAAVAFAIGPPALGAPPYHDWSRRFGDEASQVIRAVAADASGNAVVTGEFSGSIDFGTGPLTSAGGEDIFLARFDGDGTPLWSARFGDTGAAQRGVDVAVDGVGALAVVGFFTGTVDFGGGPLPGVGSNDVFIARFAPAGTHLWSKRFGDADGQYAQAVALDASGAAYVAGYFSGTIDFGGGPLVASGLDDAFIARFDAGGNHLWSRRFGNTGVQQAIDVAVDHAGNSILIGQFTGAIDLGGGSLTGAGNYDCFVAKFDPAGTHLWSKRFGSPLGQSPFAVAVDGSDGVILTGSFTNTIDLGGGVLTSAGADDIFLAKFTAAGAHLWSRRFGDASTQVAQALSVDPSGRVMLGGLFSGSVDFGGGALTSAGLEDVVVAGFDVDGASLWSARYGDAGSQSGEDVVADSYAGVFLAGRVGGSIDFGGGPLTSAGAEDGFLTRLDVSTLVGVGDGPPVGVLAVDAYPNPFNPSTTIRAHFSRAGRASVTIYDASGAVASRLVDGRLPAGLHTVRWDGRLDGGAPAASGVYFVRVATPVGGATAKLVLVK